MYDYFSYTLCVLCGIESTELCNVNELSDETNKTFKNNEKKRINQEIKNIKSLILIKYVRNYYRTFNKMLSQTELQRNCITLKPLGTSHSLVNGFD